jgi:MinD superfamily P-loop ATPase
MSLLLPPGAVTGPRKNGLIQQFLTQVDWTGETDGLDYLIVDTPPGTSDEHISTVQYLQKVPGAVSGAVLVTTPEEISMADVRKELSFCQKTKVPVLGVIENMGQYTTTLSKLKFTTTTRTTASTTDEHGGGTDSHTDCTSDVIAKLREKCPEVLDLVVTADIYPASGGGPKAMAAQYNVPYWGTLPMDPNLLKACENGKAFVEEHPSSLAAKALESFCKRITTELKVEEMSS